METFTVAQAFDLIRTNEAAIVTQFQTWLTITFATIVAVFSAKELLTLKIKRLITLLYISASITIVSICVYLAESNVMSIRLLKSNGVEVASPMFAGSALLLLLILGVATTCYFIHTQFLSAKDL